MFRPSLGKHLIVLASLGILACSSSDGVKGGKGKKAGDAAEAGSGDDVAAGFSPQDGSGVATGVGSSSGGEAGPKVPQGPQGPKGPKGPKPPKPAGDAGSEPPPMEDGAMPPELPDLKFDDVLIQAAFDAVAAKMRGFQEKLKALCATPGDQSCMAKDEFKSLEAAMRSLGSTCLTEPPAMTGDDAPQEPSAAEITGLQKTIAANLVTDACKASLAAAQAQVGEAKP